MRNAAHLRRLLGTRVYGLHAAWRATTEIAAVLRRDLPVPLGLTHLEGSITVFTTTLYRETVFATLVYDDGSGWRQWRLLYDHADLGGPGVAFGILRKACCDFRALTDELFETTEMHALRPVTPAFLLLHLKMNDTFAERFWDFAMATVDDDHAARTLTHEALSPEVDVVRATRDDDAAYDLFVVLDDDVGPEGADDWCFLLNHYFDALEIEYASRRTAWRRLGAACASRYHETSRDVGDRILAYLGYYAGCEGTLAWARTKAAQAARRS